MCMAQYDCTTSQLRSGFFYSQTSCGGGKGYRDFHLRVLAVRICLNYHHKPTTMAGSTRLSNSCGQNPRCTTTDSVALAFWGICGGFRVFRREGGKKCPPKHSLLHPKTPIFALEVRQIKPQKLGGTPTNCPETPQQIPTWGGLGLFFLGGGGRDSPFVWGHPVGFCWHLPLFGGLRIRKRI